jgi:RND superfamily putative drug exporter
MFEKIGNVASRYRLPIIIGWVVLLVGISLVAPDLAQVSSSNQEEFLADSELSMIAEEAAAKYFPEQSPPTSLVIAVESRVDSLRGEASQAYLSELTDWLQLNFAPDLVTDVLSPTDPALADTLISENGEVAMFFVGFNSLARQPLVQALETLREHLEDGPQGTTAYVTGEAAIYTDYEVSAKESFDSTLLVTIILVLSTLMLIYRSPISPLIPLSVVSVAYGVSRGLVAWLAEAGFPVSSFTDTLLVVLLFGAGTDYSLFLVSRFRGFMGERLPAQTAARRTIALVGETITSSAGTVVVGMLALSFAEFGFYANLGPSLAIGVIVVLIAGLTLTPALLALLGHWAYWPRRPKVADGNGFWGRVSDWVTARPWWRIALSVAIELPLAIYGLGIGRTIDLLADMPDEIESKAGFQVVAEEFGTGETQPLNVILTDIPNPGSAEGIGQVNLATQELLAIEGVADVRSLALPLGLEDLEMVDMLQVNDQLILIADELGNLRIESDNPTPMAAEDLNLAIARMDSLGAYLDDLVASFPDLISNTDYLAIREANDQILESLVRLDQLTLVSNQFAEIAASSTNASSQFEQPGGEAVEQLGQVSNQILALQAYMISLSETYPQIVGWEGYDRAMVALDELETSLGEIAASMVVANQIEILTGSFSATAQLLSDPAALSMLATSPEMSASFVALEAYLTELLTAYPALANQQSFQSAMGHLLTAKALFAELSPEVLPALQVEIAAAGEDFGELAIAVRQTMPEAIFVPQAGTKAFPDPLVQLDVPLIELVSAIDSLRITSENLLPDARFFPPEDLAAAVVGEGQLAPDQLETISASLEMGLYTLAGNMNENDFMLPLALAEGEEADLLERSLNYYVSSAGEATRLIVTLDDEPYSDRALETVTRLREWTDRRGDGYVQGTTAGFRDIFDVTDRDMGRITVLVIAGISLVLVILMRSIVAPIYMLLTILLSYATTLGVTRIVFEDILGKQLMYIVPVALFTFLVALGMDYNIFLMGRVKEEVAKHGTRRGIREALSATGGIISSAGIIMAGTFGAMMTSSITSLVQMGFAVAFGVLLDTFLIRTTLLPAIAVLVDRWNWWPGKAPQASLASAPSASD